MNYRETFSYQQYRCIRTENVSSSLNTTISKHWPLKICNRILTILTTTRNMSTLLTTCMMTRHPKNKYTRTRRDCRYAAPWKGTMPPYLPMDRQVRAKPTLWRVSGTTCTMTKEVLFPGLFKISSDTSSHAKTKTYFFIYIYRLPSWSALPTYKSITKSSVTCLETKRKTCRSGKTPEKAFILRVSLSGQ